ncbi:hypothetical protein [Phenylobacterium montanum]|uniref:Uncharacterized protein n=1 Tax=Phenylobacterium montanum TaxID=2823693 RepID=A0A975G355_9CAUL|nr:hypothetical protein [Caulobacter sp. S6]QUD89707.1 hypothetical protein KCG34_07505 [Caulobacter sp. S6]
MAEPESTPTGPAAAALLSAGAGALLLALLGMLGDAWPAAAKALDIWPPSGPLSGVSLAAVAGWLALWAGLDRAWRRRDIALGPAGRIALAMLVAAGLLTFPPLSDLLIGK